MKNSLLLFVLFLCTPVWAADAPMPRVEGNQLIWSAVTANAINVHRSDASYIESLPGTATSWTARLPGEYYLVATNDGDWTSWPHSSTVVVQPSAYESIALQASAVVAIAEPCPVVDFGNTRFWGVPQTVNETEPVPINLEAGAYDITLFSSDPIHTSTTQFSQPMEQWYLEGLNSSGDVVFTTEPSDDVPDDAVENETAVGAYDLTNVEFVRARHANVSANYNSVNVVSALFDDGVCGKPDGEDDIAVSVVSGLEILEIPLGFSGNVAFVVDYTGDGVTESTIDFEQTITPDPGALTLQTGIQPGWSTVDSNSWVVNESITANAVGDFEIITTVSIADTDIAATTITQVRVIDSNDGQGYLSLLGGDPGAIQLNAQSPIAFTVNWLESQDVPTAVFLESVDELGQNASQVGEMFDNGIDADLVENDRVYSLNFNTTQTEEGELFFRARAVLANGDNRFSEAISIGVTRFPPEILNSDIDGNTVELPNGEPVLSNRILVRFEEGTSPDGIEAIVDSLGATVIGTIWQIGVYQIELAADGSLSDLVEQLGLFTSTSGVLFAEPIGISQITEVTPTDSNYSQQYYLPLIRADETWTLARGGALIAVLDTGVDYNHVDLDSKVIKGKNYTAAWFDVFNWFDPLDDHSHGTHVAGIAAAESNAPQGVAGVAWNSQILAVKVCDMNGSCDDASIAAGITYAANKGAKVINLSLGGYTSDSAKTAAVNYANSKGSLVVAAAGNDGCPNMFYPAADSAALAVGATDNADNRSVWIPGVPACTPNSGSNFGSWVDMAAPGTGIHSTVLNNAYGNKSGTSMATPVVAGAAAVLMSMEPGLSVQEVRERLTKTVKPLPGANVGSGRLDLFEAVFNGSFEIGDLAGWNRTGTASSLTALGPLTPQSLNGHSDRMGYVSTGPADSQSLSTLTRPLPVQPGVSSIPIKFEYNFLSEEYPEFVGSQFDDSLDITLVTPSGSSVSLAVESVNTSSFSLIGGIDFPGGDSTVGETGWTSVSTTVAVSEGAGMYKIEVRDAGDEIYDSVLLIDNIRFK